MLIVGIGFNTSFLQVSSAAEKWESEHEKRLRKGVARKEKACGETS